MRNTSKYIVTLLIAAFFATACASTPTSTPTPEPPVLVYLNDLQPSSVSIGYSELGRGVNPFTEAPLIAGKPITAHAMTYSEGLFAHAPSQIEYKLNGEYSSISGYALMHDGMECGNGAKFSILADKNEIYTSPALTYISKPAAFNVDLSGVQTLILKVDSLSSQDCDWSVWGDPVLIKGYRDIAVVESTSTQVAPPTNTPLPTATFTPSATPPPAPTNHPGWMPEGVIARFGMGTYRGMAVSPDNSIVAVAGTSGVYFIDPLAGVTTNFLETGADAEDVVFSPDGEKTYIGLGIQGVAVWVRDGKNSWKEEEILPIPCAAQVEISPNGDILFTKCWENAKNSKFTAWDIATKVQRYQMNYAQPKTSFAIAFSPSNPELMAVAANYTVSLMEVKSGKVIKTYYEPNKNKVIDLDFSPDGSKLAITSESPEVIFLNVESAEETGRIKHSFNVFQLSFVDNKTVVAFMEKSSVVEDINGKLIKNLDNALYEWRRIQVYIPDHNLIVIGDGSNIVSISLDNYAVVSAVDGYYRYGLSYSSNENAFHWGDLLAYSSNYSSQKYFDIYKLCNEARFSGFADNDGKYALVSCSKDKLLTIDTETMKTVSSYPYPLAYTSNANAREHPWADEQNLLVLMYETPESSPIQCRIEVWNPVQNKKISAFDVDIPKSKTPNVRNILTLISPQNKYLVVTPPDGKTILAYDINSGSLVQNIKLHTPHPLVNAPYDFHEDLFLDSDALLFTRYDNFVEIYSLESGKSLQKISNLQLSNWKSCNTFCLEDSNNFTYFNKTKTFVVYNDASNRNNIDLSFTSYDIETGQKTGTTSIQLPYQLQNGEKVDKGKLSLSIDYIYLPPEKNGNIAVVKANLHDWSTTVHDSTIYTVDVPSNTILKSYTWQHTSWAAQSFAFKDFLLFSGSPDPVYFLFDVSTP